jgi:GntR family phosphonate transport system transcriptional regulator
MNVPADIDDPATDPVYRGLATHRGERDDPTCPVDRDLVTDPVDHDPMTYPTERDAATYPPDGDPATYAIENGGATYPVENDAATYPVENDAATYPVDRQDGVTLWRQIVSSLRAAIASGAYKPGTRLPTEADLSSLFGVNRHTVRRALEELSRDGLVRVEQGRGSFVAEDVLDYTVEARTRFSEWIRKHNKEPSGVVRQLREITADRRIAAGLGVRGGSRVVLLERLGFADDRPVSLTRHYFPVTRLKGILPALQATPSITDALRDVGVGDYVRQQTRVTARLPTPSEADLLRMGRSRPVLIAENVNVDSAGTIVATGCYPTPRVQIVFEP